MTRKDYIAIASALKPIYSHAASNPDYAEGHNAASSSCIHAIAAVLAHDNPAFDRAKFLAACGVQS